MARQLSATHTRLVVTGSDTAPSALLVEYVVVIDDLNEGAKKFVIESPNFTQTVSAIWSAAVAAVETEEGI